MIALIGMAVVVLWAVLARRRRRRKRDMTRQLSGYNPARAEFPRHPR